MSRHRHARHALRHLLALLLLGLLLADAASGQRRRKRDAGPERPEATVLGRAGTEPLTYQELLSAAMGIADRTMLIAAEQYWVPEHFPDHPDLVLSSLARNEEEAWKVGRRVLTEEQEAELRGMLDAWAVEDRPHWHTTAFERFADFAEERLKTTATRSGSSRGLFAPVREATQVGEDALLVAERAMYLAKRAAPVLGWQMELQLYLAKSAPDVARLLDDTNRIGTSLSELADLMEALPDTIETQTGRTLERVRELVDHESTRLADRLEAEEPRLRELLADGRSTLDVARELTTQLEATARTADGLAARLGYDGSEGPPDLEEIRATLESVSATARDLLELVAATNGMLESATGVAESEAVDQLTERVTAAVDRSVDHAFRRALVLILVALAGLVVAGLVYRYASRRLFG